MWPKWPCSERLHRVPTGVPSVIPLPVGAAPPGWLSPRAGSYRMREEPRGSRRQRHSEC